MTERTQTDSPTFWQRCETWASLYVRELAWTAFAVSGVLLLGSLFPGSGL